MKLSRSTRNPGKLWLGIFGAGLLFGIFAAALDAAETSMRRVLIAHAAVSLTQVPVLYGIDSGLYQREGIDLKFVIMRTDLAVRAMISGDVGYTYTAASALRAAASGIPVRVVAFTIVRSLFYLMVGANVTNPDQLKGKAVGMNVFGSADEVAARTGLRHLGLDPARDVTLLALGPPSTRLAALKSGVVAAAVMPLPWNLRMRAEGFRQLLDISTLVDQPTTGIGATVDRIRQRPDEIKAVLRGLLASFGAMRTHRNEVALVIQKNFKLPPEMATQVYEALLPAISSDGRSSESGIMNVVRDAAGGTGVNRAVSLADVVDYRLLDAVQRGE